LFEIFPLYSYVHFPKRSNFSTKRNNCLKSIKTYGVCRAGCVRTVWYVDIIKTTCYVDYAHPGEHVWIAGQWTDPRKKSPFVWKSKTGHSYKTYPMRYTNWDQRNPSNTGGKEACMQMAAHVLDYTDYQWNDWPCSFKVCSVCEINV